MTSRISHVLVLLSALAACGGGDDDGTVPATWSSVAENQPAALLSAWSDDDAVWIVGGDDRAESEVGPLIYRFDGSAWTQLDIGERSVDIWFVTGLAGGPVFLGGSGGTILRHQDGTFERLETPASDVVVFGIWAAAPDDVWAVGGKQGGGGGGFVWHFDGDAWTAQTIPDDLAAGTVWKVVGRSSDDVWMSANAGGILHWTGSTLERADVTVDGNPIDDPLFSLGVSDDLVVVAGGSFSGVLFEHDGSGWTSVSPLPDLPVWRGIAVTNTAAYVVGEFGAVLRREDGTWQATPTGTTTEDLHAAWIDADGAVWAVGGKFDQPNTTDGVLIHFGQPVPEMTP